MKVKLLCSRSGVGFSHRPNEEIEVDDAEGLRMIAAGQCVRVDVSQSEAERVAAEEAERVAAEEAERVSKAKEEHQTEMATKKIATEKAVKK